MIDIHCHVLPAIDDGPKTLEQSLALLDLLKREGVTTVVATPHVFDPRYPSPTGAQIEERLSLLHENYSGPIEIVGGAEVKLIPEVLTSLERQELFINRSRYMLLEFPSHIIPLGVENLFFELASSGVRPVIAHPERQRTLLAQPKRLLEFVRMGCLGQLDAPCLTGSQGGDLRKTALRWITEGLVHFVASDSHRPNWRAPILAEPYEVVRKELGGEIAQAIFHDNPQAAVKDEELPYTPELKSSSGRARWFQSLFGAS